MDARGVGGDAAAYAFGPRGATPPAGFSVAADQTMLDALGKFGALEPHPGGDRRVRVVPVEARRQLAAATSRASRSIIAFGAELTRRLDEPPHPIDEAERAGLATLRCYRSNFVDLATLNTFEIVSE